MLTKVRYRIKDKGSNSKHPDADGCDILKFRKLAALIKLKRRGRLLGRRGRRRSEINNLSRSGVGVGRTSLGRRWRIRVGRYGLRDGDGVWNWR